MKTEEFKAFVAEANGRIGEFENRLAALEARPAPVALSEADRTEILTDAGETAKAEAKSTVGEAIAKAGVQARQ